MTTFQKWILVISALVASSALSYCLLIYLPTTKKAEVRKQAGVECSKRNEELVKSLPHAQTEEQLQSQMKLIVEINTPESTDKCIEKVLDEWGYDY